ncbi:MAG: DUF2847 family protein [Saprospirales bacterium]|nr:DUF2847 family protein [Saprospirales bacterium]
MENLRFRATIFGLLEKQFCCFKHSTRCSISTMAKNRVEREWNLDFPIFIQIYSITEQFLI